MLRSLVGSEMCIRDRRDTGPCKTQTADGLRNCASCYKGYYLSGTVCVLVPPISGCMEYDEVERNKCVSCARGWMLEFDRCTAIGISGCIRQSPRDPHICLACGEGWFLQNGTCEMSFLEGCIEYDPNDGSRCLTCAQGLIWTCLLYTSPSLRDS